MKKPALWQNILKMFDVKLRKDEKILCCLKSNVFQYIGMYFMALFIAAGFFLTSSAQGFFDVLFQCLLMFYCLLYPACQKVVFTNRRVICRGGWRLFREQSFALPEIKIIYNPIIRLFFKRHYALNLSEDGNKMWVTGIAINSEQMNFIKHKYTAVEQSNWLWN